MLLGGLVLFAGAVRFYGLSFGLPANFHPDEVPKVNAVMRMVDHGDLNPRYFLHPSLLLYSCYFVNTILQYVGSFFGVEGTFRETAFLAGRVVSATAGTLSVGLVYLIGRRLYGSFAGFTAALLLAVFPLHVTCSRYLKEDALLVFFFLTCIALTLKAAQEKRQWLLYLAG
ncbi:MAG: phospholipid carrier-dependent glycosyltransferase, partial [Proteobacteria bacterium]|nr:phospholipid carrier-dependent glycosyltransferase [Pseudomonadota bacterium]